MPSKYDWKIIQTDYDAGMSQRELRSKHGVHFKSITMAIKRGDLIPRTNAEGNALAAKKGRKAPVFTTEFLTALSERQSLTNSGGRCKWFWVGDQHVQGTWERDAGIKLTELGIDWRKCAGKADILRYTLDGRERSYTPDFYLPAHDVYLEFKGYWWGDDRRKMDAVLAQHPHLNIVVVEQTAYNSLIGGSLCPLFK